jgi:LmbE family N-acetylglucosaminyl deacetylase
VNPIILAPHGSDETLFVAYTCMRVRAHVIVCSQDADQTIRTQRSLETAEAITILGCSHHEIPMPADQMDWDKLREKLEPWNSAALVAATPDHVYAPAAHPEGDEHHNKVAEIASEVFGGKTVPYLTHTAHKRLEGAREVIPTPDEIHRKLRAVSCYRSQIEGPTTRRWFFDLLDMREWLGE